MELNGYRVERIAEGFFAIDDRKEDSMYLVVGEDRALLIDTCMMPAPILPTIMQLTDKPVSLALTHAHIDHMYHADEFETVYLHEADIAAWRSRLAPVVTLGAPLFGMKPKRYDVKRYLPVRNGDVIDLGGVAVRVLDAAGHTPGSCAYVVEAYRAVLMGDAVGSGLYAWMWLPGCLCVSDYRSSLLKLRAALRPYEAFSFYGGHRAQTGPSEKYPDAFPLDVRLVEDMSLLCERILAGELTPAKQRFAFLTLPEYSYGHARAWERKSLLR